MITLVRFLSRKLTGTWAAWEPREEHPGGLARCFLNFISGLGVEGSLVTRWWIFAISCMRHLLVFQCKGIWGAEDKFLLNEEVSGRVMILWEAVSNELKSDDWIISFPKGWLEPSVPSRQDISSNSSEFGLFSWSGKSERWRGLQKYCRLDSCLVSESSL